MYYDKYVYIRTFIYTYVLYILIYSINIVDKSIWDFDNEQIITAVPHYI
jgi:hypothetical protein